MNDEFNFEIKEYKGQKVEINRMDNDTSKIVRVISTDPKVFLKKDFQPGSIIKNYKIR